MNCNQERDTGYTLIIGVDYPVYLPPLHRDLPFLYEKKAINGANKLLCTFYDKKFMYVSFMILLDY